MVQEDRVERYLMDLLCSSGLQVPLTQRLAVIDVDELLALLLQLRHKFRDIVTFDPCHLEIQPLSGDFLLHQLAHTTGVTRTGVDCEFDIVLLQIWQTGTNCADEGRVKEGRVCAVEFVEDFVGLVDGDCAF